MTSKRDRCLTLLSVLCCWHQACAVGPSVSSGSPTVLSERAAVVYALRHSPTMASARLSRLNQRTQLGVARDQYAWQWKLGATNTWNHDGTHPSSSTLSVSRQFTEGAKITTTATADTTGTHTSSVAFTQPLLRGMGRQVAGAPLDDALDQEYLNQLSFRQQWMDTLQKVVKTYRRVLSDRETLEVQRLAYQQAKQVLKQYQIKIRVGEMPRSSIWQQKAQVLSERQNLNAVSNQLESDRKQLMFVMGKPLSSKLSLDVHLHVPSQNPLPPLTTCIHRALAHNLDFLRQKRVGVMRERAYHVAQNQQLWDVSLTANADADGTRSASLAWSVPLHDVSRKAALTQAKTALLDQHLAMVEARRSLSMQVTNAWRNTRSLWEQLAMSKELATLAKRNYALAVESHIHGRASALQVVQQQQAFVQAQENLINLKVSFLNSLLSIHRLMGDLLDAWHISVREGH